MRLTASSLALALAAVSLSFGAAKADPKSEYAWCATANMKDNIIYYSDVFDVDGLERDVSSQWYGFMQYHLANADLSSARCFIDERGMSLEDARADRDRYVQEMHVLFAASPTKVATLWTVTPYW